MGQFITVFSLDTIVTELLYALLVLLGPGHGHEQAHEAAGRPQDHARDKEGHWQRGPHAGRFQRQDPGNLTGDFR